MTRYDHLRVVSLLNLPIGAFVEYVQRLPAHYRVPEVLQSFSQPDWRKYWREINDFHEDLIRYVFRPTRTFAHLKEWTAVWTTDNRAAPFPDNNGTPFPELVFVAAANFIRGFALDYQFPFRQAFSASLPGHPIAVEYHKTIRILSEQAWVEVLAHMTGWDHKLAGPSDPNPLAKAIVTLIDGHLAPGRVLEQRQGRYPAYEIVELHGPELLAEGFLKRLEAGPKPPREFSDADKRTMAWLEDRRHRGDI